MKKLSFWKVFSVVLSTVVLSALTTFLVEGYQGLGPFASYSWGVLKNIYTPLGVLIAAAALSLFSEFLAGFLVLAAGIVLYKVHLEPYGGTMLLIFTALVSFIMGILAENILAALWKMLRKKEVSGQQPAVP